MKKKVILVPDDSNVYILLVSIQLKKMGYVVRSFRTADELVANIGQYKPDMVFLDNGITEMDCSNALKSIKENENTSALPVAVISSDPSEACRRECLEMGAESFIMMPLSVREMHEVLQRCLYIPHGYQRDYLRVTFTGNVVVTHDGIGEWLRAETLSEKGIYVRKKYPYPVGSELSVSMPLLDEKSITMEGRVIYINEMDPMNIDEPSGMAIMFDDSNLDNLIVISNFVEGLLMLPSSLKVLSSGPVGS